ncbi:lysylphosphatidylglycerol synthase domain-containing protein [Nonlabens marinus]|uniref:Dolichol-P-glucose synthetase n=1 Tax=Nonlabens marinus S1-08 TaxID=1454201 RepID=W8VVA7_9FLAO|nr:lysylphosphatidylglycerol synthase domain-containing protein [Nonlabens marinus]BAO55283.1 hypothetical protein NMS_1274 [Nonlabens marinus S1-08]
MSHKSKQFLLQAGKLLVILCCLAYVFYLFQGDTFDWHHTVAFLSNIPIYFYLLLPGLSIASWLVESYKWQYLVRDLREVRFRESVIHNLTSQATSFITPLRAGEFATKAFYFESSLRKKVLKAVLVGNMSQMAVTIIVGVAGVAALFYSEVLSLFSIIFLATLVVWLGPTISKRIDFQAARLDGVILLSFLRYALFSGCWLILLSFYSNASLITIAASVAAMYLATSLIPSLQLFDILIKWSVATFFVSYLNLPIENMTAIVAIVWLNNTVLPALLGCGLLAFQRFPKLIAA